jgi:hypothetical protein
MVVVTTIGTSGGDGGNAGGDGGQLRTLDNQFGPPFMYVKTPLQFLKQVSPVVLKLIASQLST